MVRFLLVEAAQVTVRSLPEWGSQYFRLMMRRGRKTAKMAMARRLAIRLYWMWREGRDYEQCRGSVRTQESPEILMVCHRTPKRAPLDGSAGHPITDFKSEQIWSFSLSPDRKSLAVLRGHYDSDAVLLQESK